MKRTVAGIIGLLVAAMLAAQAIGVTYALRRKRDVAEAPDPASDEIALTCIFDALQFASTASAFRGGTLACLFGGGVLDLRGATLAPGGATLRVEAFSGGAQILVPEDWQVVTKVVGLGGVGDARPQVDRPTDAPVLRIEGRVIFGGFGVASEASEAPKAAKIREPQ
jgi:hypothetical protein